MKKTIFLTTALAGILSASAVTDAAFNAAYQNIRKDKKNQPRYCQYRHDLILADLAAYGRTNELTAAQQVRLTAKRAEHALADAKFDREYAEAMASIRAVTNAPLRNATLGGLFDAYLHTYSFSRPRGLPEAEKILAELAPTADGQTLLRMRRKFVEVGLATWQDRAKAQFDREYAIVRAFAAPADAKPGWKEVAVRQRADALGGLLAALVSVDPAGANALFARDEALLDAKAKNAFRNATADYAIRMKDRPLFDSVLKGVLAEPVADQVAGLYRPMLNKLHAFDADTAAALVKESLANPALTPGERMFFLSVQQGFDDPPIFDYGFNTPGRYGRWRTALLARKAIAEANPTNRACVFFSNAGAIGSETERMIWYDDLATAKPIIAEGICRWPTDRKLRYQTAQIRAIEGDAAGAADALAEILALKGTKADESNKVNRVVAFLKGAGLADFDRVNAPLGLTSAQRLKALRETSRTLFTYRRDADCQAIFREITEKMYRPDPRKTMTAKYVKDAPQTAGAFAYSPYYADWKNYETRFAPYGDCYGENAAADEKWHLKDAKLPTCDPAWKTGVAVLYDDEGVHLFIRCDDPEIAEVKDGKRTAGNLEMFFAPGGLEVPYHSIFFNSLPTTDDPHAADWCSPGRHYRRNTDAYVKDAALTPEGVVAHVSLPWISFYDNLPVGGNLWNVGVIRSCKGGMQTSGGIVHELSRGIQIRFDLTGGQLLALKRKVSVVAYNRYRKIREDAGEFIQRWNDPLLGDPAFYAAEVAPLVKKLDEAGVALTKPCADAEVEGFFRDFAPLWAEIGYEIAERRTRFLGDRLFDDDDPPHVVAKIADCDRYEALNPRFKKAFAFLKRKDLADLKPGRYEIDGENCWAMVQEANLTPIADENTVEMHRKYIDIQAPITGPETMGLVTADAAQLALPFDVEKDYVLFKAPSEKTVTLEPGEFVLFFPPFGAHAPCHSVGAPRAIRKLVIKVRADEPGWVGVEGMRNVRDIGGWTGLVPGRAFRGTEPDGIMKDGKPVHGLSITSNGLKTVRAEMRIKTDLDLRGAGECPHPDSSSLGVALVRAPVQAYEKFDGTKAQWAAALRVFSDARNYPIYFHCWGGADRTGILALLLEGLCGVSEVDLGTDYELTTQGGFPRERTSAGFAGMLARVKARPGTTLRDKFADFVEGELGLTKAEIASIRANLTEVTPKTSVPTVLAEFRKTREHPRNSEGDVTELGGGRLLVVFSHFYRDEKSPFADGSYDNSSAELVLTESADGGKTWSPLRTIVRKPEGTLNVMSASFLRLGDGRLAVFYLVKATDLDCRPAMIVSSDEGKTWSKPVLCVGEAEKGYYVLNNARAVRLAKTGRLVLPLACHTLGEKKLGNIAILSCAISDDDGKTWRLSADRRRGPAGTKDVPEVALQEPGLVELKDGRLMMYARSSERRQWRLYSQDGGDHWSEPEPVTEYSTTTFSPVTYARLKDGRLVVVFNDGAAHAEKPGSYERRWPLTVGVSSDEGKTWVTKLLEPDDPSIAVHACYIAVREIGGRLVLVYCYCDALATTRVTSVPLEWLPKGGRKD